MNYNMRLKNKTMYQLMIKLKQLQHDHIPTNRIYHIMNQMRLRNEKNQKELDKVLPY